MRIVSSLSSLLGRTLMFPLKIHTYIYICSDLAGGVSCSTISSSFLPGRSVQNNMFTLVFAVHNLMINSDLLLPLVLQKPSFNCFSSRLYTLLDYTSIKHCTGIFHFCNTKFLQGLLVKHLLWLCELHQFLFANNIIQASKVDAYCVSFILGSSYGRRDS